MNRSGKLFHAIEAVLYIAYHGGQKPVSARGIAARQGMPARYLEQLMQKLVRAGILRGVRGPGGGYLLARERRRVTVADICEALKDDPPLPGAIGTPLGAVVAPVWSLAYKEMMEYLRRVSLAELCDQAEARHIRKESEEKMDFTI